jgi:Bacterial antitoxin of ParD toxin-antitoxin type II system and RHH
MLAASLIQSEAKDIYPYMPSWMLDAKFNNVPEAANETQLVTLRHLLDEGEKSELVNYSYKGLINELDDSSH